MKKTVYMPPKKEPVKVDETSRLISLMGRTKYNEMMMRKANDEAMKARFAKK